MPLTPAGMPFHLFDNRIHHVLLLIPIATFPLSLLVRLQHTRLLAVAQPAHHHGTLPSLRLLPRHILPRDRLLPERLADQLPVASANLLQLPVSAQGLVAPADLASVGFAVFLGIETGGLDAGA